MFTVLTVVYGFIIFIVLFGDYEEKELNEWKEKWERITGSKYE